MQRQPCVRSGGCSLRDTCGPGAVTATADGSAVPPRLRDRPIQFGHIVWVGKFRFGPSVRWNRMMTLGIPPKCPPKRGFRSWRERLTYFTAVAFWFGLTTFGYTEAIAVGIIEEPPRVLAVIHIIVAWSPLLLASSIWKRWGRAAFPLEESATDPPE